MCIFPCCCCYPSSPSLPPSHPPPLHSTLPLNSHIYLSFLPAYLAMVFSSHLNPLKSGGGNLKPNIYFSILFFYFPKIDFVLRFSLRWKIYIVKKSSSVCKFPPLRGSPSAPSLMFIADLISQVLAQSSSSGGPSWARQNKKTFSFTEIWILMQFCLFHV